MPQKPTLKQILLCAIITLSIGLLVWQRVDAPNQPTVTIGDTTYARGETIDSGDRFVRFHYANTAVWLDKNTQVTLIDATYQPSMNVVQGRIVTSGPMEIRTREVHTQSNGQLSYVHYSWLNEVDVAVIGTAQIFLPEQTIDLEQQALHLSTLPPYAHEPISFTPYESSAADFYRFVDGE